MQKKKKIFLVFKKFIKGGPSMFYVPNKQRGDQAYHEISEFQNQSKNNKLGMLV
jgi:hypothetical protein